MYSIISIPSIALRFLRFDECSTFPQMKVNHSTKIRTGETRAQITNLQTTWHTNPDSFLKMEAVVAPTKNLYNYSGEVLCLDQSMCFSTEITRVSIFRTSRCWQVRPKRYITLHRLSCLSRTGSQYRIIDIEGSLLSTKSLALPEEVRLSTTYRSPATHARIV